MKRQVADFALEVASLNLMLDASVDCIKLIDLDGNLQKMNRAGCESLGVPYGSRLGMKWLPLLPKEVRARGRRALKLCQSGKRASFAGKSLLPGQSPVLWDNILTPLLDDNGSVSAILCVSRDVTRQMEAERKLCFASDHDALSTLANRRYLVRHAKKAMQAGAKKGELVGVLILDVDHFKAINDENGHDAGDCAIKHIAKNLERSLKKGEFLARLGGDEFALFVETVDDPGHLEEIAARCMKSASAGFTYKGKHISTRFSIGGSLDFASNSDLSSLLRSADEALYKAKEGGRGYFHILEPSKSVEGRSLERSKSMDRSETEVMTYTGPAVSAWEASISGL